MSLRLHEVHPSIVHYPLALVPAALLIDVVGRVSGSRALMRTGRYLMPAAAVAGVAAGVAGLVAQQAVRTSAHSHKMLVTHRNLNMALVSATGALAIARARRERPGWGYLLVGFAGAALMQYTAYLGGKMVYSHGVGVEAAKGVRPSDSPEIRREGLGDVVRLALLHIRDGLGRTLRELMHGEIAPMLRFRRADSEAQQAEMRGFEDSRQLEDEEAGRYSVTGYGGAQGGYGSSYYGGRERGTRGGDSRDDTRIGPR
ncbi:MAG TPA: DUF2231 domain-containing protein [Steroidobacteraceae bacterium]|nr:DUF2231 domain-containing protein [Steroidobacteraceae bacterium]